MRAASGASWSEGCVTGEEMYHAIIAKDYKPLQKLPGFGVHLLLHTDGTESVLLWAGCGASEQVLAG